MPIRKKTSTKEKTAPIKNVSGKTLLIVESPAKAKTINKYLGDDFVVRASVGHVRDLPKSNKKAIDIEHGFIPHYEILKEKRHILEELSDLSKKSKQTLLATDPDREGEAIAWHIKEAINPHNVSRITFNEITEDAVQDAIKHPRAIDENLRKAQEARRVLDRLVGYDLSGIIWKKVRYGLSAGRVQSPALRIILEREREIRAFIPEDFWVITAVLKDKTKHEIVFTCSEEPRDENVVKDILEKGGSKKWQVVSVKETEAKRQAKPPFTTSTLQQTASTRLGFSPSKTMLVAQKLYEAGLITYMRTDSVNLSKSAVASAVSIIKNEFGDKYASPRSFANKSKNAQEAHEAIRPSSFAKKSAGKNSDEERLYSLIWKRAIASQMSDALVLRTRIETLPETNGKPDTSIPSFVANGSVILFDGWLKADPDAKGEDTVLPSIREKDEFSLVSISEEHKQTTPPPRYSEAGLVKELEKRGIGRPSTYATIIKTIVDRGYVTKENKSLVPTDTGDVVSSFLEEHFTKYVSDEFTAEMENELDEIAEGKRDYTKTLEEFYKIFSKALLEKQNMEKVTNLGTAPAEFTCPLCGSEMMIKLGKTGRFMSCAKFPGCLGARTIEGEILEGPKETGEDCPECKEGKLIERDGKFGRFVACNRYPKCKYIKKDENAQNKQGDTGVACPQCNSGTMLEKRGRFGIFYSCSNYPSCKNAIKSKPTGNICKYQRASGPCGHLMMEGTKTIPERCSDKTCPNHNPHKL